MSDDLEQYRADMRAWLEANLPRREGAALRSGHDVDPEALAAGRELQRRVYEAGYLGITVPVDYGGQGLTSAHQRIWAEESARYAVPLPGCQVAVAAGSNVTSSSPVGLPVRE